MQPVQLHLGFSQPERPLTLHICLAGLVVIVDYHGGTENEAWAYLHGAGVHPSSSEGKGLSFPVKELGLLVDLPPRVTVVPDATLRPLWLLLMNPSHGRKPAELSVAPDGSMWLAWFDGSMDFNEEFPPAAAAALLTADLPFVATQAGFEALRQACQMPLLVGRCRVNFDGFVEVSTSKPQLVESAPIPALFRVDDTHFGVPLAHADAVASAPGFVWEGPPPRLDRGPRTFPALPMPLSKHAAADLRQLVDSLAAYRAQAVVWESGLGRRVFALAAIEVLDAWPLLIVCPPASVWAWQRHLEMFGRSGALTHEDADAHIVTYRDLAMRTRSLSPQAVIFDDISSAEVNASGVRAAVGRLGGLLDAYRLAVTSQWPTNPADVMAAMSMLRPGEFLDDVAVFERYPTHPSKRLAEHVACYVSERRTEDPGRDTTRFRRSSVVALDATTEQKTALSEAAARHAGSPAAWLAESLEICSAGPTYGLSPKVAEAVARVQDAIDDGRRVAVLTRHRRTESLLRATLRAAGPVCVEASAVRGTGTPQHRLVIVRFERELPDLTWFDEVFVLDYPWSTAELDAAVGSPTGDQGPLKVTCLHLAGTVDDRLAMLAARRRELGGVIAQTAPPSTDEMAYLLADRGALA